MAWALRQYIILGVTTNIPFLQEVITHPVFRQGQATITFIEEHFAGWQSSSGPPPDLALVATALSEMLAETQAPGTHRNKRSEEGDIYSPWQQLPRFRLGTSPTDAHHQ
jgi:pyruvate carboxylase